jgi:outer membrane protein
MPRGRISQLAATLILAALIGDASAEDACTGPSDDCVAAGGWNFSMALGAGVRTNPLVHSQEIPLVIVPQVSYYGKRFFLDNLDLGVTLAEGSSNTLSLVASPGYDRVFFYRTDLQNVFVNFAAGPGTGTNTAQVFPPRPRHITYLAGPEWTFELHGVTGQLDYLHEITAQDHGNEIRAALSAPIGQLAGSWKVSAGLTWKSAGIVNYYYGEPGYYQAGSAVNPFVKLSYSKPLNRKWKLNGFVHYERLGEGIANSPIVAQRHVTTVFIGATYAFRR